MQFLYSMETVYVVYDGVIDEDTVDESTVLQVKPLYAQAASIGVTVLLWILLVVTVAVDGQCEILR